MSKNANDIIANLTETLQGKQLSIDEYASILKYLESERDRAKEREKRKEELRKRKLEIEKKRLEKEKHDNHVLEVTSMDLPLDYNNPFFDDIRIDGVLAESIPDALIMSLNEFGNVNMEYIASITGEDYKTIITTLKGSIYQNPDTWDECFYKGWETSDEYLSGNLYKKLQSARAASKFYNGYFDDNIRALEDVMPDMVPSGEIYVTLGSPWLPTKIIDEFIGYLMEDNNALFYYPTIFDEETGIWTLANKNRYKFSSKSYVRCYSTYGTQRINALQIIEKTLNMSSVKVMDTVSCPTNVSGKRKVVNEPETVMALEKQKLIIKKFQKWIWSNPSREGRLTDIFNEKYCYTKQRHFNGDFLTFPEMSKNITLYPYQKNAVARIILSPNTLLAHEVGSGKTYIMIAAGMEMKRMGISDKNLYVVPNNIINQWENIFHEIYPSADVMCVRPKDFTTKKRPDTLFKLEFEKHDAILMTYSVFDRISIDNFSKLNINTLFVDEAHNYKNVPIKTRMEGVLGINATGSKKCDHMMKIVQDVQAANNGRGVVFATGTPLTNSITDAFVMQKYLQNGELHFLNLHTFDNWVGMFAESSSEFEIDVDTSNYRLATRFAKFHNLPELTSLLGSIADFHHMDLGDGIPDFDGYDDCTISKTPDFHKFLQDISLRAERVRLWQVSMSEDNMLKITTDGRKAALDLRLVDDTARYTPNSKVAVCAQNVFNIYNQTQSFNGTQLVFCDISVPKKTFNIYDELAYILTNKGIPYEEIAFVHDAKTDRARKELFAKVRSGKIRILLGSTFKLGMGVNVQDRLAAIHHLDVPWRPADMVQREGRILRQGNMNKKVRIFRYVTEGSFDAYSWQLLETKQRFISQILSGSVEKRSASDISDTVLNYAEVKAIAIGNPLVKQRVEADNELSRYLSLQRKAIAEKERNAAVLAKLPEIISNLQKKIDACEVDIEDYNATKAKGEELEKSERKALREHISQELKDNFMKPKEREVATYQGFKIILPAAMLPDKPKVIIEGKGRYTIDASYSSVGILTRIDNFLNSLEKHLNELTEKLVGNIEKKAELEHLSENENTYAEQITYYSDLVKELDRKLGVH